MLLPLEAALKIWGDGTYRAPPVCSDLMPDLPGEKATGVRVKYTDRPAGGGASRPVPDAGQLPQPHMAALKIWQSIGTYAAHWIHCGHV